MRLKSYVGGEWRDGKGEDSVLVNPVNGEEVARACCDGIDLEAALEFARSRGGPALRSMTYAARGRALAEIAQILAANRKRYGEIARLNSGNTRRDARIDIDGGIYTLRYFAALGERLGDTRLLTEPGIDRLSRDGRFAGGHVWTARAGAAIHLNAFNFPCWGLWEKAAVALLSGVPVMTKPAAATAWLSYETVRDVVEAGVLPNGALSLLCGRAHGLVDSTARGDVVALTGSSATARALASKETLAAFGARLTVEADSLNASILGPDAGPDSEEFALMAEAVCREMTEKAGQKCTAIRRILVPETVCALFAEAVESRLAKVLIGDPAAESVGMGPLVNKAQQAAVRTDIEKLQTECDIVFGEGGPSLVGADPARGAFVAPVLLWVREPLAAHLVHEVEIFGPCATLIPFRSEGEAFALAGRGGGSLVASVFSADDGFADKAIAALAPDHGRLLFVDASVGTSHTGHGNVMPQCVHGGPGRAGGGEELGGLRGLRLYHQRTALQANDSRLIGMQDRAAQATL